VEQLVAGKHCFLRLALVLRWLCGADCCWKDLLSPASFGSEYYLCSSFLLKGPAFSRKRWHYSLYMEQLVAGTTYFLRHVLALFSFSVAACCQTVLLSSASVGITFSTWSGLLVEGPAFSRKRV